jgi:hypothetical protein
VRPRWSAAATLLALVLGARPAAAQAPAPPGIALDSALVSVRDVGPGATGRLLRAALAAPHHTIVGADTTIHLVRGTTYERAVVVLGGDVTVAASVRGDVIVIGGDLFLRPGAVIDGRAIAVGGGVYNSLLAVVGGGQLSYRDHTYDAVRLAGGGYALDYRTFDLAPQRVVQLPFPYGFRIPSYDRVDGLSLPFGPTITIDTGRLVLDPVITYRSHLGAVDPSVRAVARRGRRDEATLAVGRTTLTNEQWIRGDVVNSALAFAFGSDVRNYYRADRADLTLRRRFETERGQTDVTVGALTERAWSVGRDSLGGRASRPFAVLGRDDEERMLRPNPRVERGRITSALVGARTAWEGEGIGASGGARIELPLTAPGDRRFVQATLDAGVNFTAFTTHRFRSSLHALATVGDSAPPQRFSYLGGSGTIPTFFLLSAGGDQLVYVDNRYTVPIDRLRLPFVGPPSVTLRHMIGAAGVQRLPAFRQNLGLALSVGPAGIQYTIDPSGQTSARFSAFVEFSR